MFCCKEYNARKKLIKTSYNYAEEGNIVEETGEIAATCVT